MKHCAKKLLGLVFALALCLAVGGNALADGPEAADVWMLSDVWMLADEPNVTTAPDTTTVGDLANDGYTVTIPKTVEVNSTTNEGTLTVTAQMKQWRTLNIAIAPQDTKWTLKYQGATGENMPEVAYQLPQEIVGADNYFSWVYHNKYKNLTFMTAELGGSEDVSKDEIITAKLAVTVPNSEEATMSGTYADTLTFYITPSKLCVTYNINVYKQDLKLTENGTHIAVVDKLDENGDPKEGARPDFTKTFEYPTDNTDRTWSYSSGDTADDTLRWEELPTVTMNPYNDKSKVDANGNVTINLNLKRKWYWLDVNGATDYASGGSNLEIDGNQGGRIASSVNLKVSVDGKNWSEWFWYTGGGADGDDYWGTFPYGIHFKLGLHHVKNGYVYDKEAGGGVKIIANGKVEKTGAPPKQENGTSYYVYEGTLTGDPIDTSKTPVDNNGIVHEGSAGQSYQRYCYIPCYQKGVTYRANGGTGGTEDVSGGKQVRSNVLYEENSTLKDPKDLDIQAPAGKVFAGWSTESTYTEGNTLYPVGTKVSEVKWEPYTGTELDNRPAISGKTDDQKRELYAIWGSKVDITIQFEDETGYTVEGTQKPVLGGEMSGYTVTLENQVIVDGADWVLDLNNVEVKNAIEAATDAAKKAAEDTDVKTGEELARKIWKIDQYTESGHEFNYTQVCKISAEKLQKGTTTLMIQRRRYLLSVLSAEVDTGKVLAVGKDPDHDEQGTFAIEVNGSTSGTGDPHTSFYQRGLNYGASYTVYDAKPLDDSGLYYAGCVILQSLKVGDGLGSDLKIEWTKSYSSHVTGKEKNIHYYTKNNPEPKDVYTGDPVRVAFWKTAPSSDTPVAGPTLAPGLSGPTVGDADADGDDTAGDTGEDITQPPAGTGLTLRYHANFVADDAVEEAVKTVACAPGADVVLKTCMFKRAGYTFTGWNTEKDGMGRAYKANGVPVTDWSDGDMVDLYAQWEKTVPLKPVVSGFDEDTGLFDPFAPPEELDPGFGIDPDADPADEEGPADDADAVDDAQAVADEEAAAAPPEELDFGFGIDPDAAVGGPAPFVRW